jgi:xanthine dehydrogenase accessory factor
VGLRSVPPAGAGAPLPAITGWLLIRDAVQCPAPFGGAPGSGADAWLVSYRRGKLGSMTDSGTAPRSPGAVPQSPVPPGSGPDPACGAAHGHSRADASDADAIAHGYAEAPVAKRTLIAVFASPVARFLLSYARDAGFRPLLVDPDAHRVLPGADGFPTSSTFDGLADDGTDVVVTDHHRPELGAVLRDALATRARWVGVMGNPRHPAPHIPALEALGVPAGQIARVHRPIGLNIGSRTPAEIAVATLAGLIADRNGRPGGFEF